MIKVVNKSPNLKKNNVDKTIEKIWLSKTWVEVSESPPPQLPHTTELHERRQGHPALHGTVPPAALPRDHDALLLSWLAGAQNITAPKRDGAWVPACRPARSGRARHGLRDVGLASPETWAVVGFVIEGIVGVWVCAAACSLNATVRALVRTCYMLHTGVLRWQSLLSYRL